MTIETRTEIYYYCTVCDKEYAAEDKEDGLVCLSCHSISHNHDSSLEQGCQSCMRRCFVDSPEQRQKTRSHLQGCGQWFCKDCVETTDFFDAWYPRLLCKECVSKYGLERFYGDDHGEAMWNEIEIWRKGEFGHFPMKSIPVGVKGEYKTKSMKKGEMDQKIFQRFYISPKNNKKKSGVV